MAVRGLRNHVIDADHVSHNTAPWIKHHRLLFVVI